MTAGEQTQARDRLAGDDEVAAYRILLADVVDGGSLPQTLADICHELERIYPETRCLIMLLDRTAGVLRFGAGPSVSDEFAVAVDGLTVGRDSSVLSETVMRGKIHVVSDAGTDSDAGQSLGLLERGEIRSACVFPLRHAHGPALGAVAVYRHAPHTPSDDELATTVALCNVATLAIEQARLHTSHTSAGNVDEATGLSNRIHFLELVNERLRQPGSQIAVMAVGIDRFKQIRDHISKLAGDRILSEIVARLVRGAGDQALVGRYGEDEFTVMAAAPTERFASRLADQLLSAFDEPIVSEGGEFFVTATIGIAHADGQADAYGLIGDATTAMHAARSEGLGRRRTYDIGLQTRVVERVNREAELRNAIMRDELVLHYQPCLDLRTRRWTWVEALVRWNHPEQGLIGPDQFIPLAEETGLINQLGVKVLVMAIKQARSWWQSLPEVRLAVNVSVMQFANPTFADDLLTMLTGAGLPPEALILEITESALMHEPEMMQGTLNRLGAAGMPVALDDFGTGHSSIARLRELPVRSLKVDHRLTADICTDAAARTVVSAIAAIARAHDMLAVAEGLEDLDSLALVTELGYAYGQGHYLARPAAVELIDVLLRAPVPDHLS